MSTQIRTLGRTGVRVSALCLGGMNFGEWANRDHDDCVRIVHAALDAGINFIDTADVYSAGESEEIIGKAIAGRRDRVVLATKFNGPMGDDPNQRGGSRRWIMRAVEDSLRRLQTDWIDLYQVHRYDPDTDLDETLATLTDLVRAGKIRYFGTSTFAPHQVVELHWLAERRGLERPASEQPPYSLLVRRIERELLGVCRDNGMGVLCWSPLAGGWLSGHFLERIEQGVVEGAHARRARRMQRRFELSTRGNLAKPEIVRALTDVAEGAGTTLPELAIAFVLNHPAVTSAIIGPRTIEQVTSLLGAAELRLDEGVLDRIDEIVPPGTTVNPDDDDHIVPRSLADKGLRRR